MIQISGYQLLKSNVHLLWDLFQNYLDCVFRTNPTMFFDLVHTEASIRTLVSMFLSF